MRKFVGFRLTRRFLVFEILNIDEANGFLTRNKRKIINLEESKSEEELKELKKIGINSALVSIEKAPAKKH